LFSGAVRTKSSSVLVHYSEGTSKRFAVSILSMAGGKRQRAGMRHIAVVVVLFFGSGHAILGQSQPKSRIIIHCGPATALMLRQVKPIYPAEARASGIQGVVRISLLVSSDGVPESLRLVSGPPELVNASLDAVRQWRYRPFKLNGKAVPVEATVNINYVIPQKQQQHTAQSTPKGPEKSSNIKTDEH
jgi:TonB family protein